MTPSEEAKLEGFKSLTELALFSRVSTTSLRLYHKSNKRMWEAKLKEAGRRKEKEDVYNRVIDRDDSGNASK